MAGSAQTLQLIRVVARARAQRNKAVLTARPFEAGEDEDVEEEQIDLVDELNGVRPRPRSKHTEEEAVTDSLVESFSSPVKTRTTWGQKRKALILAHNDLIKSRKPFNYVALVKAAAARVGLNYTTMKKFFDDFGGQDRARLLDPTGTIET